MNSLVKKYKSTHSKREKWWAFLLDEKSGDPLSPLAYRLLNRLGLLPIYTLKTSPMAR